MNLRRWRSKATCCKTPAKPAPASAADSLALTQRLDDIAIQSGNDIKEIKEKQDAVQIDFKDGKPTFRTGDGLFTMSIRGRAHLDAASYDQDDNQAPALSSGANFRRAELGVEGTFMRDWGYKMNFQWGDSGAEKASEIKDLYLSYNGIENVSIMAGAIQTFMTLDDSTSSVDTETEKEIQKALDNLVQGRTTIAIAHRLSTLRKADRLVVLDKGVKVEEGTHDQLIARRGAYWRLYEAQARQEKAERDRMLVVDEAELAVEPVVVPREERA